MCVPANGRHRYLHHYILWKNDGPIIALSIIADAFPANGFFTQSRTVMSSCLIVVCGQDFFCVTFRHCVAVMAGLDVCDRKLTSGNLVFLHKHVNKVEANF